MSSSNMQPDGQETTIISSHFTLLHQGMIIVGLPGCFEGLGIIDEVAGGSFYEASTIVVPQGARMPSENELAATRFQGRHVSQIARKLFGRAV
jgi:NAD(P)H dehydrogenase (quinone)